MKDNNRINPPDARKNGKMAVRGLMITALLLISLIASINMGLLQNAEGLDPHVIKGYVYETNGSVVPSSTTITILNTRTGQSSTDDTNATGYYSFNLLNLASGWAVGDSIQVNCTNATDVAGQNSTHILIGTSFTTIDLWIGATTEYTGISFYIIGDDGEPVNNALINIKDNSGDIVTTKMSDTDGKASTTLLDGLYTFTIGKAGYDDVRTTARVHGTNGYSIRLGEAIEEPAVLTDLYTWALLIFACVGIVTLLLWIAKKV